MNCTSAVEQDLRGNSKKNENTTNEDKKPGGEDNDPAGAKGVSWRETGKGLGFGGVWGRDPRLW